MISFNLNADVKGFMNRLLKEDAFDSLEARSAEIACKIRFSVSGALEEEGYITWGELRPAIFNLIKSGDKPKTIKIVFSHKNAEVFHPNAAALFLNMIYENDNVTFTTATAQKQFNLEKSLNEQWDEHIIKFFNEKNISIKIN